MKVPGIISLPRQVALRLQVNQWYAHMDKTFLVMLDRSMWFAPIYESVSTDNMRPLTSQDPRLAGSEKDLVEPILFACGYAQIVFLCTAVEVYLLQHYINSVVFFLESGRASIDALPMLKSWVEARKDLKSWQNWLNLTGAKRTRSLTALSFSDFETTEKFFSDIYGKDCFARALSKQRYSKVFTVYQELQTLRNGIVHRGGEHKDGRRIEVQLPSLQERHKLARWLRDELLKLSAWFRDFWFRDSVC